MADYSGSLDFSANALNTREWGVPDPTLYSVQLIGQTDIGYTLNSGLGRTSGHEIDIRGWIPETFSFATHANFQHKLGGGITQALTGPLAQLAGGAAGALGGAALQGLVGGLVGGLPGVAAGILHGASTGASAGARAGGRINHMVGNILSFAGSVFGIQPLLQAMTLQTWESSAPLSFTFPMLFDAKYNASQEVVASLRSLARYCQPYNSGVFGLLKGPGPTFYDVIQTLISGAPYAGEFLTLRIGKLLYIPMVIITSVQIEVDSMFTESGAPISARADVTVSTAFTPTRADIDSYFIVPSGDSLTTKGAAQLSTDQQVQRILTQSPVLPAIGNAINTLVN